MATTRWSPGLETGHPLVDEQHRRLFDMVEEFESPGKDRPSALRMVEDIMAHVDDHFSCEEALMDEVGYPLRDREAHISEHAELKEQARQLVLGLRSGGGAGTAEIAEYLTRWLVRHTTMQDMSLVRFIAERS